MSSQQNSPHPLCSSNQVEDAAKLFAKMPLRNSNTADQHSTLPRRSPRLFRINNQIQTEPTTILRRSPRFLRKNRKELEDPKTPNQENRAAAVPLTETSFILTPKVSQKTSKTSKSKVRNVLKESNFCLEESAKQNKGSRRSEGLKAGEQDVSCIRRSSRLSGKENVIRPVERSNFDEFKKNENHLGKEFSGNTHRSTRKNINKKDSSATHIRSIDCNSAQFSDKGGLSVGPQLVIGLPLLMTKMTGNSNQGHRNLGTEGSDFDEFKTKDNHFSGSKVMRAKGSSIRKTSTTRDLSAIPIRSVDCNSAQILEKGGLSDVRTTPVIIGLPAQSVLITKMTSNSNRVNAHKTAKKCVNTCTDKFAECSKAEVLDKGFGRKGKLGLGSSDQVTKEATSSRVPSEVRIEKEGRGVDKKQKCIGVKRKRNQASQNRENHGHVDGWTNDQDSALQRAYFVAKPTPHFWKKVAKMVPGKSAQDCFDRIHADYLTPPQRKPRSRAKVVNSSPVPFSASKLLDSTRPKTKKPRCTKQKSRLVQKAMRKLLQKQYEVDRDQNADLFSVLEAKPSTSTNALQQQIKYLTPKQEKSKLLKRCQQISSSASRKQCSRFNSLNEASLASPPVLKPVKNKALHEKYIDQLLVREAKRNAASAKAANSKVKNLNGNNESCAQKRNLIKSAKDALLLDAKDAINQFEHVQANAMSNLFDVDEDVINSDEDII